MINKTLAIAHTGTEESEGDIRQTGENGPAIDSIALGEFESSQAVRGWLTAHASLPVIGFKACDSRCAHSGTVAKWKKVTKIGRGA